MMKTLYGLFSLVVFLAGGFLFHTKHEVMLLEQEIGKKEALILQLQREILLLRGEWTYLTHPKRVEILMEKYLPTYKVLKKQQVVSIKEGCEKTNHKTYTDTISPPLISHKANLSSRP